MSPFKRVTHLDEKVIKPKDRVSGVPLSGSNSELVIEEATVPSRPGGLHKSMIGRPSVYDLKGNLLAEEENLVVITGREFLACSVANVFGASQDCTRNNLGNYKITHFGVGDGGASDACPPVMEGPFDDDTDLGNRVQIGDVSTIEPLKYINGGSLKQITFDGEIRVVSEEHTINVPTGGQKVVDAYTAIRYRMYLQPNEPKQKPFRFNEAGLFAVEYAWDNDSNMYLSTGSEVLFARFVTLDKWLDTSDGIMIEWYILV